VLRRYDMGPAAMFWQMVTDLGDSAVTLPLAGMTAIFLLLSGWPRAALLLALVIAGCGLTIGLLKLALESCGHRLLSTDLTNPSGHVAMSAGVYGAIAALVACSLPAGRRWISILSGGVLIAAIGASRIALNAHNPGEVALGLFVGTGTAIIFQRKLMAGPIVPLTLRWLAIASVVMVAAMYGTHWPIEDVVRRVVAVFRSTTSLCV
jgi:membrane-associated phospholipid phosphatase